MKLIRSLFISVRNIQRVIALAIIATGCLFFHAKVQGKDVIPTTLPNNNSVLFTRNDGQIVTGENLRSNNGDEDCRFYTHIGSANFFFCTDGVVADYKTVASEDQGDLSHAPIRGHVLKINFLGRTNFLADVEGEDRQRYKCNYFLGSKSHTNVPNFSKIVYVNVWQGVDVTYYGESSQLKYDVIVRPGTDPAQIRFGYEGAEKIKVNDNGSLIIKTSLGDITEQTPYVYQIVDGRQKEIPSHFQLERTSEVSFSVGEYDRTRELIIDPLYSTYLGGTGNEIGAAIAVDKEGCAYITGYTSSKDFPVTTGSYQTTFSGSFDVFVAKLNPSGDSLVYSTFLGGASDNEGYGIAVDVSGNSYVTGNTNSVNFPTTSNAYQLINMGGYDAFVTVLNSSGDSLIYSSYLGGLSSDFGTAITVDRDGDAYITGQTSSANFPTTSGAYQTTNKAGDAFVSKIDIHSSRLVFSTMLGGVADDRAFGVAVDGVKNVYVTGQTKSIDYPTTIGTYQTISKGGADVFVTKLNSSGDTLLYSTYLSGTADERSNGIAVDTFGNAYVVGQTLSTDFPTTKSAYQTVNNGKNDAFVTKLSAKGDSLVFSTYIGGSNDDLGAGIATDAEGSAYITGVTYSADYPTTTDAFQAVQKNSIDAFITKINVDGTGLLTSTYLGGSGSDHSSAIAVDSNNSIYLTGNTTSPDFPMTVGAYQTKNNGGIDVFISKFSFTVSDVKDHAISDHQSTLFQNYPNPFSSVTSIPFVTRTNGVFEVRDMLGRIVYQERLVSQGIIQFDGSLLRNGVYSYTVYDGSNYEMKRMLIAK